MSFNTNPQELDLDYCRATSLKRFTNYIIDLIFFYILIFCAGAMIGMFSSGLLLDFDGITDRLISLLFYGILMSFIEAMSNGKSIGKIITGTRAVNLNGSEISFTKAFMRNMVRAIPFYAISGLSNPCEPWHDRLSDTMVVDEKKLDLQRKKVNLFGSFKNQTL